MSQGVAARDGGGAEGRQAPRARRHRLARAGHRHRRGRPGRAAPGAAERRARACSASAAPGHLVGQTSKGRIYATHREDLVEAAAVVRGHARRRGRGDAYPGQRARRARQQIIAAVAVDEWDADALYALVRRAYPYRDLLAQRVGGRARAWSRAGSRHVARPRPRLARRRALPGIAPTTAWPRCPAPACWRSTTPARSPTPARTTSTWPTARPASARLDEEFIFETRPGDVFMLGSSVWRVEALEDDRVIVGDAAGQLPRMPFWKGDYPWRSYELGERIGVLRREVAEQIARAGRRPGWRGRRRSSATTRST